MNESPPNEMLAPLRALVAAHSTPGDEGDVAALLEARWRQCGLRTHRRGRFAISARRDPAVAESPTVLVCAHMDSPGYIVEEIRPEALKLIPLGGAHFEADEVPAVLKSGDFPHRKTTLRKETRDGSDAFFCDPAEGVRRGDRVCFRPDLDIASHGRITSPFLDNRLGCLVLHAVAESAAAGGDLEWVLGATACEEMGGFGAPVLARSVQADLVIVVDATYQAESQDVLIGGGPVLTLSDASVLLSPVERDRILGIAADRGLPLQTEVYNVSGTDARGFPLAGLPAPVLALLIASEGNHTPRETASLDDVVALLDLLPHLAKELAQS